MTRSLQSIDAAFVRLEGGATVSNTIGSGESHGTTLFAPVVGATVVRIGSGPSTPFISSGRVTNAERLIVLNGQSVWVSSADYLGYRGDSGGIVFRNNGSANQVVGIHVASANDGSARHFSLASRINSVLGLTMH